MKAILPAAGYATRLQPLTSFTPKPLLLVGKKRMVEHVIDRIEVIPEITEIHIVTNNVFFKAFEDWKAGFKSKKKIFIHNDGTNSNDERLGTMGDTYFVLRRIGIDDDILLINADNLFDCSLTPMLKMFHEKKAPILAVKDLGDPKRLANKFGTVLIDKSHKIIDFEEKPSHPKSSLAATGIYLYTAECMGLLENLVKTDKKSCDNSGDFVRFIMKKMPVYAFSFKEMWYDVGGIAELREAHKLLGGGSEYD